jgi:hypothetical protein
MSSESFQQMMARLRARDQDLDDRLAILGEELQEYARDHHDFIAAVDADQGPAPAPQDPVSDALNIFGSTQVVAGAAPDSDADVQMGDDDESVVLSDESSMDDESKSARRTPRRRVAFAESDVIIAGMPSPQASEAEQQEYGAESVEVEMPSHDAPLHFNRPEATGKSIISVHTSQVTHMLMSFLDSAYPPVLHASTPAPNPQDFVGTFDRSVRAGGPIKPLQQGEYEDLSARAEEVNTHYVCPYPECGNMYTSLPSVDRHLRRDHPDWAIIKDQVMDPNSKCCRHNGETSTVKTCADSVKPRLFLH